MVTPPRNTRLSPMANETPKDIASYRVRSVAPLRFEQAVEATSVFAGELALVNALEEILRARMEGHASRQVDLDMFLAQFRGYANSERFQAGWAFAVSPSSKAPPVAITW